MLFIVQLIRTMRSKALLGGFAPRTRWSLDRRCFWYLAASLLESLLLAFLMMLASVPTFTTMLDELVTLFRTGSTESFMAVVKVAFATPSIMVLLRQTICLTLSTFFVSVVGNLLLGTITRTCSPVIWLRSHDDLRMEPPICGVLPESENGCYLLFGRLIS